MCVSVSECVCGVGDTDIGTNRNSSSVVPSSSQNPTLAAGPTHIDNMCVYGRPFYIQLEPLLTLGAHARGLL